VPCNSIQQMPNTYTQCTKRYHAAKIQYNSSKHKCIVLYKPPAFGEINSELHSTVSRSPGHTEVRTSWTFFIQVISPVYIHDSVNINFTNESLYGICFWMNWVQACEKSMGFSSSLNCSQLMDVQMCQKLVPDDLGCYYVKTVSQAESWS